ncbi:hypothetical protein ACFYUV_20560 [Nonomuraea sp. NPDC003560]|uniref:hypothetical protein n=1 Tax=Nonomuraea sp. NPDC003560 TaxID=3364341 RepID=UPI003697843D
MSDIDASDLDRLITVLEGAEKEAASKTYPVVERHAEALRDLWQKNARRTAKKHGKRYPRTITTEQVPVADAIEWTVGPESALPQGGMGRGFEYGSANQPPHLDGAGAAVIEEPKFMKSLDEIVKDLL